MGNYRFISEEQKQLVLTIDMASEECTMWREVECGMENSSEMSTLAA
jgi:hypothetical protein